MEAKIKAEIKALVL